MTKRIKAFLFTLLMAFALTGCQNAKQNVSEETRQNEPSAVLNDSTTSPENPTLSEGFSNPVDNTEQEVVSTSNAQLTPAEEAMREYINSLPTFDISQVVSKLPEIPDWKSEASEELYLNAKKNIPEEILEEYNRKVLQGEIENGENLYILYGDNDETITSIFYDKANEQYVMRAALFSQNEYLVVEEFNSSSRTVSKRVYSDTEKISDAKCFVDFSSHDYTLLFTDKRYDLSVVYDENTSELVCLRYYQELGDRIPVSAEDIKDFERILGITGKFYFRVGYKNENSELVSPIILDNGGNISFHLIKNDYGETESYFYSAMKEEQEYWICGDSIYYIKNLIDTASIGYCEVGYVKGSKIEIESRMLDYASFTKIEISQWDGPDTVISAMMGEYLLFGGYEANYCIWEMISDALFIECFAGGNGEFAELTEERLGVDIQDATFYECSNWSEAEKIINESMRER